MSASIALPCPEPAEYTCQNWTSVCPGAVVATGVGTVVAVALIGAPVVGAAVAAPVVGATVAAAVVATTVAAAVVGATVAGGKLVGAGRAALAPGARRPAATRTPLVHRLIHTVA